MCGNWQATKTGGEGIGAEGTLTLTLTCLAWETLFLFSRILPSLHVTLLNVPLITPHDKRGTSACRRAAPFDSFYEQMLYAFHVRWRHKLFAWLVVLVQMGQSALQKRNADVLRIRKGIRQNVENAPFSLHLVILNKMSGT